MADIKVKDRGLIDPDGLALGRDIDGEAKRACCRYEEKTTDNEEGRTSHTVEGPNLVFILCERIRRRGGHNDYIPSEPKKMDA